MSNNVIKNFVTLTYPVNDNKIYNLELPPATDQSQTTTIEALFSYNKIETYELEHISSITINGKKHDPNQLDTISLKPNDKIEIIGSLMAGGGNRRR